MAVHRVHRDQKHSSPRHGTSDIGRTCRNADGPCFSNDPIAQGDLPRWLRGFVAAVVNNHAPSYDSATARPWPTGLSPLGVPMAAALTRVIRPVTVSAINVLKAVSDARTHMLVAVVAKAT